MDHQNLLQPLRGAVTSIVGNPTDFLVYAAIAVVTLIGVFRCLIPLMTTRRALRRAITRLQNDAGVNNGGSKPVWQGSLFVGKRLRTAWLRFLQNAEQLDRRGLPCNVEDYINDDTVTHGPGNATLAELIPGLLTSLGILGTFMGMVSGLSGFSMENPDSIMNGIPILLEGMRFAFGTSVAGVSCSLVFNMMNRILQGASYRAVDDFVSSFTQLAMSRPLDNDVQLICQNQDRNHMLSNVTDTLADRIAENIECSVSRAMTPVARSMDSFIAASTRAQVDGVGKIVDLFLKQMNDRLNTQFLMLGQTMVEINQRQQISAESAARSLESVGNLMEDTEKLHGVSEDILKRFENYISEISFARQRDSVFERDAGLLLERMNATGALQGKLMTDMEQCCRRMEESVREIRDSQESLKQADEHITGPVLDRISESAEQLGTTCQRFVCETVDGLNQTLAEFSGNMKDMVRLLSEKAGLQADPGTSGSTSETLGRIQRISTDIEKTVAASLRTPEAGKE